MSSATAVPADALAATQRVQQLQALLAQTRPGSSAASFAAALAAASAGPEAAAGAATSTPSAQSGELSSGTPYTPGGSYTPGVLSTPGSASTSGVLSTSGSAPTTGGPSTLGSAPTPASAAVGSTTPVSGSAGSSAYDATISQVAARYGLDPAVLHGLIQQESGFNPAAQSSAGALGLTQLMPSTAASLGVTEPLNPTQSIEGGARYLSEMLERFGGNTADALAAYNAGPGAVAQYGGVPPYAETREYVSKVLANANAYRQSAPSTAAPSTPAALSGALA